MKAALIKPLLINSDIVLFVLMSVFEITIFFTVMSYLNNDDPKLYQSAQNSISEHLFPKRPPAYCVPITNPVEHPYLQISSYPYEDKLPVAIGNLKNYYCSDKHKIILCKLWIEPHTF